MDFTEEIISNTEDLVTTVEAITPPVTGSGSNFGKGLGIGVLVVGAAAAAYKFVAKPFLAKRKAKKETEACAKAATSYAEYDGQ